MRCLYCVEDGTSTEAVAVCTVCGAGVCIDHVVRTNAVPGIMTHFAGAAHVARGPLCCQRCTGRVAVTAGRSGGTATRTVGETSRTRRVRLPHRRVPREVQLTAADVHAAVTAAEHLVRRATGDSRAPMGGGERLREWWRGMMRRLAANPSAQSTDVTADEVR